MPSQRDNAVQRASTTTPVTMLSAAPTSRTSSDALAVGPRVDVRVVLFTVAGDQLLVTLDTSETGNRLPRGLPSVDEPLDAAARRTIRDVTCLQERYLEQLYTLSVRESEEWTIIVSYMGLAGTGDGRPPVLRTRWLSVESLPQLSAPDRMVIDYAVLRLRAKLGYTNVAFHLLPPTFTLSELQRTYEAVLGRRLDKRNFRRRVIASGILSPTEGKRREGSHRPAALYRFRSEHDTESYLTPPWAEEA